MDSNDSIEDFEQRLIAIHEYPELENEEVQSIKSS